MRYTTKKGSKVLRKEDTIYVLEAMKKLRDYENLEEKLIEMGACNSIFNLPMIIEEKAKNVPAEWKVGSLFQLPGKIGGRMFRAEHGIVQEYEITKYDVTEYGISIEAFDVNNPMSDYSFADTDIGEIMFFTREDAQEIIEKEQKKKDNSPKKENGKDAWMIEK